MNENQERTRMGKEERKTKQNTERKIVKEKKNHDTKIKEKLQGNAMKNFDTKLFSKTRKKIIEIKELSVFDEIFAKKSRCEQVRDQKETEESARARGT